MLSLLTENEKHGDRTCIRIGLFFIDQKYFLSNFFYFLFIQFFFFEEEENN